MPDVPSHELHSSVLAQVEAMELMLASRITDIREERTIDGRHTLWVELPNGERRQIPEAPMVRFPETPLIRTGPPLPPVEMDGIHLSPSAHWTHLRMPQVPRAPREYPWERERRETLAAGGIDASSLGTVSVYRSTGDRSPILDALYSGMQGKPIDPLSPVFFLDSFPLGDYLREMHPDTALPRFPRKNMKARWLDLVAGLKTHGDTAALAALSTFNIHAEPMRFDKDAPVRLNLLNTFVPGVGTLPLERIELGGGVLIFFAGDPEEKPMGVRETLRNLSRLDIPGGTRTLPVVVFWSGAPRQTFLLRDWQIQPDIIMLNAEATPLKSISEKKLPKRNFSICKPPIIELEVRGHE